MQLLLIGGLWLPDAPAAEVLPKAPAEAPPQAPKVLVLGDSLSAGYGIARESGWVALLQRRLEERGFPHRVINASISGDTTAGGLTRLPALLARHDPEVLVIELGANDGLRGLALDELEANLTGLIGRGKAAGARALVIGIRLPPNYGTAYTDRFQAVFEKVAAREGVAFLPRLLAGIAEDWGLMQPDGLHPTAKAQPAILENVWPVLEPLLLDTLPTMDAEEATADRG